MKCFAQNTKQINHSSHGSRAGPDQFAALGKILAGVPPQMQTLTMTRACIHMHGCGMTTKTERYGHKMCANVFSFLSM